MLDEFDVDVHNGTPLTLTLECEGTPIGEIELLSALQIAAARGKTLVIRDKTSQQEVKRLSFDGAAPSLVVTVADLRSKGGSDGSVELTITNGTNYYLDMCGVDESGETRWLAPRLAPHQAISHAERPHQCIKFVSVFTGAVLDVCFTADQPRQAVEITTRFLDKQQQRATRPPDPQLGQVKLVGQARTFATRQSRDYIFRSERSFLPKEDLPAEKAFVQFNTLDNRLLRHVEISGVELVWDSADTCGLKTFSGSTNIRSLTMYADRVVVGMPLKFHRTDVTIYARELVFEGDGSIDTTPYAFAAPARSAQYMKHANGKMYPADAKREAVYRGADGRDGEQAGRIELFVWDIRELAGQPRFTARGSPGQAAEDGDLKPYQPKTNQPKEGKKIQHLEEDAILRLLEKEGLGKPYNWTWPGSSVGWFSSACVDWPGNVDNSRLRKEFKDGHIGHVRLGLRRPGPDHHTYEDCYFLPYGKDPNHRRKEFLYSGPPWLKAQVDPDAPRPGDGEDAYPSGRPGKGGDGGVIISHFTPIAAKCADVGAGTAGPKSKDIEGGQAGEPTKWLTLVATQRFGRNCTNFPLTEDNYTLEEVRGERGERKPGQTNVAGQGGSVTSPTPDTPALAWLHETSLEAVLNFARDAFRMGCRDTARSALEPYYAALAAPAVASVPDDLHGPWVVLDAMRTNLNNNADFYGNPPGWVPRLAVTTNYGAFQTIRAAASEVLYFAARVTDDYDQLQNADELAQRAADALGQDLENSRKTLKDAYAQLAAANTELDAVQEKLNTKGQELFHLRAEVQANASDRVAEQRAFSAAFQLVGGLMKLCPVGQPVVAQVGDVFSIASGFDWTKDKPWEEAGKVFKTVGGSIGKFITENKAFLTEPDDSQVASEEEKAKRLGRQLSDMKGALKDDTDYARAQLDDLESKWRRTAPEIQALADRIKQGEDTLKNLKDVPVGLTAPVVGLGSRIRTELGEALASKITKGLDAWTSALGKVQAERGELVRQILTAKGFTAEQIKSAATQSDGIIAGWVAQANTIAQLDADRAATEKRIQTQKDQNSREKKAREKIVTSLKQAGEGLGTVGSAVCAIMAPFDAEDPSVKALVDRMLDKSSRFHDRYVKLKEDLDTIAAEKRRAVETVAHWHQQATAAISQLTTSLTALAKLSQRRQSLSGVLDAGTRTFLKGMQQRAQASLQQSIYYFVQAYQYEFLEDVGDDFYTFDTWVRKLRNLEETKQVQAASQLADAQKNNVTGAELQRLEKEANRVTRLGQADFNNVETQVLRDQLLQIFVRLLEKRQQETKATENTYEHSLFTSAMVQQLNDTGRVRFNFVRDFRKGTFKDIDFRAAKVTIEALDIDPGADPTLSLRIRIRHSGQSVILTSKNGVPVYYGFRAADRDEPISWSFTWNHGDGGKAGKVTADVTPAPAIDQFLKQLLENRVGTVEEYKPSLFSDFELTISNFAVFQEARAQIKRVSLGLTFQDRGTADAPGPAR